MSQRIRSGVYFYPRPPRGGRRQIPGLLLFSKRFLSTPSARRATAISYFSCANLRISIHALREEGDLKLSQRIRSGVYFYPRPPRGGRLKSLSQGAMNGTDFYPRPPRGGRPYDDGYSAGRADISIHALREEGDGMYRPVILHPQNFYPRPPRGGRRVIYLVQLLENLFLSTPSARRATYPG